MSKIILTSGGIKNPTTRAAVQSELQDTAGLRVLQIVTAASVVKNDDYTIKDTFAMQDLGMKVTRCDLAELSESELMSLLDNADIVYVNGGNGYYLLKHARESGFTRIVPELVRSEKLIYIGHSAGSYLACPSIEMIEWMQRIKEWRRFGIEDFTALGLVDVLITAHFDQDPEKKLPIIQSALDQTDYKVIPLTNRQILVSDGSNHEIKGEGDLNLYKLYQQGLPLK